MYIHDALNIQISVYVHPIDRLIDVEKSKIKLSYKGGWEALGQVTGLQRVRRL